MLPLTFPSKSRALALVLAGVLATPVIASAQQVQDTAPVDVGQLLQALRTIRQQQTAQLKANKQSAFQAIAAAAGSNERATAFWEEAIKATQMDGAGKENAQLKAWKDSEGEAFKEKEVQNAVRLHLQWLALTLQRSGGVPVKELLPSVINYTKELLADEIGMEALAEGIKKEKEAGAKNPKKAQASRDDATAKKVHDSVLNKGVASSVVVQWLKIGDFVSVDHWETNPGNLDGIYKNIILPEFRAQKDLRVFEYWDMKLKKEGDNAVKTGLKFEIDKFNTLRRPTLLWSRTQEFANMGMKNRAFTEMFNLIKTYPTHPDADDWIAKLEQLLMPPIPAAPPGVPEGTPATPPVSPGTAIPSTTEAPTVQPPATNAVVPVPGR